MGRFPFMAPSKGGEGEVLEEGGEARRPVDERLHSHEPVVAAGQMRADAGMGPILGAAGLYGDTCVFSCFHSPPRRPKVPAAPGGDRSLLTLTTQACDRPPRPRSELGTSSGQPSWAALVIISTHKMAEASVAAGAAMTRAGRRRVAA